MTKTEKRIIARRKLDSLNRIVRRHRKNPNVARYLTLFQHYEVKKFIKISRHPTVKEFFDLSNKPEITALFDELNNAKT